MTGRDRLLATLNHEMPDRVPIIIGTTNATGMKMGAYRSLKRLLGIEAPERYLYDWPELGTALLDEEAMIRLGSDARSVLDRFPASVYEAMRARDPRSPCYDDWGSGQSEVEPGLWYPGLHPLPEARAIAEIESYPWPDMEDPTRVAHVGGEVRRLAAEGSYAILGCPWLLFPFERAHAMQGLDRFLENMIAEPDFARALLWKIESLCERLMGSFLDAAGGGLDIVKIGDDLGTQESLLISPAMYRDMLKPVHAALIAFIKSKTRAKVLFHSDGDVFDLLPDLVEIGVDIINPVQSGAGRMSDLGRLKKAYGKNLVFCGAMDTQRILPYGRPDEVRAEVRRVIGLLGGGGGYILSAVHTIMNEVPPENVLAMVDAAREFGAYPIA
jgi:uroporphyrinogen decarboxylase